jgi:uncharacterized membrane protein YbaN (DUF454 family)
MASQRTRAGRKKSTTAMEQERNGDTSDFHGDGSEIKFATDHGLLTVRDSRMFQRGQERFCRGLAMAAAKQQDVRSAQVDLGSSTFRLEFTPGRVSEQQMSSRFAEAVRDALSEQERANQTDGRDDDWAALAAFPAGRSVSSWEIIHESPDYLKLRNGILRQDSNLARRTAKELRQTPGIITARVSPWRRNLKIRYDASQMSDSAVVNTAEAIMRRLLRPQLDQPASDHEAAPVVATGMRRVYYLAMASGSFTLTIVGLVVPGVPTVPFLMATSYYLVRSSPRLNRMLLRSRFFGPIVADLQSSGGLRPLNKRKLIGLTLAVSVVTILLTLPPLSLLLLISGVSGLSIYAVSRIPGIPGRRKTSGRSVPAPAMA